MTDTPPPTPPQDPPTPPQDPPVPPEPPVPAAPPTTPPDDGSWKDAMTNAINALTETVGGMQSSDSKPVRKPWTHWGSKK